MTQDIEFHIPCSYSYMHVVREHVYCYSSQVQNQPCSHNDYNKLASYCSLCRLL